MSIRHTFVDSDGFAHPNGHVAFLHGGTFNLDEYGRPIVFTEGATRNMFEPASADTDAFVIDHPVYFLPEKPVGIEYLTPTVTDNPRFRVLVRHKFRAKLIFPYMEEYTKKLVNRVADHPTDQFACFTNLIPLEQENKPFLVYNATESGDSNVTEHYRADAESAGFGAYGATPNPFGYSLTDPLRPGQLPNDLDTARMSSASGLIGGNQTRILINNIDEENPIDRVQTYSTIASASWLGNAMYTLAQRPDEPADIGAWLYHSPSDGFTSAIINNATTYMAHTLVADAVLAGSITEGFVRSATTTNVGGGNFETSPPNTDIVLDTPLSTGNAMLVIGTQETLTNSSGVISPGAYGRIKLFIDRVGLLTGFKFRVSKPGKITNLTGNKPPIGLGDMAEIEIFGTITQAEAGLWK